MCPSKHIANKKCDSGPKWTLCQPMVIQPTHTRISFLSFMRQHDLIQHRSASTLSCSDTVIPLQEPKLLPGGDLHRLPAAMAPALAPALVGAVRWHDAIGVPGRGSRRWGTYLPSQSACHFDHRSRQWTVFTVEWFLIGFFTSFNLKQCELNMEGWHHCEGNMMKRSHSKPAGCIPFVWLCISQTYKRIALPGLKTARWSSRFRNHCRTSPSWHLLEVFRWSWIKTIWWFCTRLKSSDLKKSFSF